MAKSKPNPDNRTLLDAAKAEHKHRTSDSQPGADKVQAREMRAIKHFASKPESRLT